MTQEGGVDPASRQPGQKPGVGSCKARRGLRVDETIVCCTARIQAIVWFDFSSNSNDRGMFGTFLLTISSGCKVTQP